MNKQQKENETLSEWSHLDDIVLVTDSENEIETYEKELISEVMGTPYTKKRMDQLSEKYQLDKNEKLQVTKIINDYEIKPKSVEKLLDAGIASINEVEEFVYLHKEVNGGGINLEKRYIGNPSKSDSFSYWIPDVSGCISYQSIIFLRNFISGSAGQIMDTIEAVEAIDNEESGLGVGVLLHRMRELYEKDESYRNLSPEMLARASLNKLKYDEYPSDED